jgi:hypothetical protein
LFIEWNSGDIDRSEPFLDLTLCALALVDEEIGLEDFCLLIARDTTEVLLHPVLILDCELACHIATNTRDTLLPIQYFIFSRTHSIEVDQSERISLEDGLYHCDISLAIGIDIVPLILRLDRECARESKESLPFELVVDESIADISDSDVGFECGFHRIIFCV